MLLKEFIYYDRAQGLDNENDRYLSHNDTSILRNRDVRKTRLTLSMINDLRKASESHNKEVQEELGLIRKMYAQPPAEQATGL